MKKRVFSALLAFFTVFSLCACSNQPREDDGKLKIVAANFPAYDFCRQIASTGAQITMLLSPGEEAHSYDPTPQDIISIKNADIFVYGGGESDTWANSILSSAPQSLRVIAMLDCVNAVDEEIKAGMHADGGEKGETEYDEHVWMAPLNAVKIAEAITQAVCEADSENAAFYRANALAYTEQLELLDGDFAALVSAAKRNTLIFADRFPALYFVRAYGLDYWAAYPGCAGETESNPSTVAFLIKKVKELGAPAVFKLELSSGGMAESVANETKTQILTFYSCQTVSKKDFDAGEGYISLMRRNLDALSIALN